MRRVVGICGVALLTSACADLATAPVAHARVSAVPQFLGVDKSLMLNAADLDSIEVIKGAAASRVYGSSTCTAIIVVNVKRAIPGDAKRALP
jgi:hypothetical protein